MCDSDTLCIHYDCKSVEKTQQSWLVCLLNDSHNVYFFVKYFFLEWNFNAPMRTSHNCGFKAVNYILVWNERNLCMSKENFAMKMREKFFWTLNYDVSHMSFESFELCLYVHI